MWLAACGEPSVVNIAPCQMTQLDYPDEVAAVRLRPAIDGRITLLGVTGTPNEWQRPVINAGNSRAMLDLSGSRGFLVGGIPANK